jgi:tetratricopeptide (TPR) repeat protein
VEALYLCGNNHMVLGHLDEAERLWRQLIVLAETSPMGDRAGFIRMGLSGLLLRQGRWREARAEAERSVEEIKDVEVGWGTSYSIRGLGWVRLLQGEREAGVRQLQESLEMAEAIGDFQGVSHSHWTLAWLDLRDGRPQDAIDRLLPIRERLEDLGLRADYPVEAEAWMRLGQEDRAAAVLASTRAWSEKAGERLMLVEALTVSAALATRQGRWEDARQDVEDGLRIAREIGLPYDEALLLFEAGRMYQASGDTDRARESLMASLATFQRLGAKLDAARAEEALRALSPHPPAPSPKVGEGE